MNIVNDKGLEKLTKQSKITHKKLWAGAHFLTVDDNQQGNVLMKRFPNLMGEVAIYRVSR